MRRVRDISGSSVTMTRALLALSVLFLSGLSVQGQSAPLYRIKQVIDVAPCWSGNPVGFSLVTEKDRQFIAFYDPYRQLTLAARDIGSTSWQLHKIDEFVALDTHNSVFLAIDQAGFLHMSGNMHVNPLKYWRTSKAYDITTFERHDRMVGQNETRCTYPRFFTGPGGELLFKYRDGHSGAGNDLINVYDTKTRTWQRKLEQPLTDGKGLMNAYANGPSRGSDGFYHFAWVWRDTYMCETNHDVSYARSKDLVHWTDSFGKAVELPITIDTGEIVDPIGVQGGLLNNLSLSFDAEGRVVLSYLKFDADGNTQAWAARREEESWKIYQITDWPGRWDFSGGGSIVNMLQQGAVGSDNQLGLTMPFANRIIQGDMTQYFYILDEETLQPTSQPMSFYPPELSRVRSKVPGMMVSLRGGFPYQLRWETLDRARDVVKNLDWVPKDQMLQVVELEKNPAAKIEPYKPLHDRHKSYRDFFAAFNCQYDEQLKPAGNLADEGEYLAAIKLIRAYYLNRSRPAWPLDPRDHPAATHTSQRRERYIHSAVSEPGPSDKRVEAMFGHRFSFGGIERRLAHDIGTWQPYQPELLREWNLISPSVITYEAIAYKELESISPMARWYNELNRLPHLRAFGDVYFRTRLARFARRWIHDLGDWRFDNPAPAQPSECGPWYISQAGVRLKDCLVDNFQQFLDAPEINDQEFFVLFDTLLEHCDYIYQHLPAGPGTKYDRHKAAVALQQAAEIFPEFKEASSWRERAWNSRLGR